MKNFTRSLLAASIFAIAGSVSAMPITGSVGFGGTFTHNGTSLLDATFITVTDASVLVATGDFSLAGVNGSSSVSYSSFDINPAGPVDSLWSVGDFVFDLTSISNEYQSTNFLVLQGVGTISAPGFDDTHGDWLYTSGGGNVFTWSDTNDAVAYEVPEPAITLLLGAGLLGVSLSRKLRKTA